MGYHCDVFYEFGQKRVETCVFGLFLMKQDQIDGETVADGWAGTEKQKPLEIQKYLSPTGRPTNRPTYRIACLRLKRFYLANTSIEVQ